MADPSTLFGVNLDSVRDRLRTLEYFTSIDNIQDATEAFDGEVACTPPAAFVSIASEIWGPNRIAAGGFSQRCQATISILAAIPAERRDGALTDEVEQARKVVLALLIGWTPDGAGKPLEARRYSLRAMQDGLVWFEWTFETDYHVTRP